MEVYILNAKKTIIEINILEIPLFTSQFEHM